LAAAYTLRHPERLKSAILADPWGMVDRPEDIQERFNIPFWVATLFSILKHFNPLAIVRASGPLGPGLLQRSRPDILRKYQDLGKKKGLK
jgi:pimeloyl-ACP methyl ester carboxylesterase